MKLLLVTGLLVITAGCGVGPRSRTGPSVPPSPQPGPPPQSSSASAQSSQAVRFVATADSVSGITAKGTYTHRGIVAADPTVLPLGSVIRVSGAGAYSGTYVVTDTGRNIVGHRLDIYMPSYRAAKRFGRKPVFVEVIQTGDNRRNHLETTAAAAAP